MSTGLAFCRQVLASHPAFSFLQDFELQEDDFRPYERRVLDFIQNHIRIYNQFPEITTVEIGCGIALSEFHNEPLEFWADELKLRSAGDLILRSTDRIRSNVLAGRIEVGMQQLAEAHLVAQQRRGGNAVVALGTLMPEVLENHDRLQQATHEITVPFGFAHLDAISGGIQGGDFTVIMGITGSGKTYLMIRMMQAALEAGKVPLFVTTEMMPVQVARRFLALRTRVPATLIRLGRLSSHIGRPIVERGIISVSEMDIDAFLMKGSLRTTLDDVVMQIRDRRPDVVYIDGAYLLKLSKGSHFSRYEQVSGGAEILKLLSQDTDIPIVATYQTKKGTDDVYMSKVIQQIASIVIQISDIDTEDTGTRNWLARRYKLLELTKGREGEVGSITVSYDMGRMEIEQVQHSGQDGDPYE
jgi:replicative DNA helicase